jgi:hypothetical protein
MELCGGTFSEKYKNKYQFVSDGMGVMGGSRQKYTNSGNIYFIKQLFWRRILF